MKVELGRMLEELKKNPGKLVELIIDSGDFQERFIGAVLFPIKLDCISVLVGRDLYNEARDGPREDLEILDIPTKKLRGYQFVYPSVIVYAPWEVGASNNC